MSGFDPGSRGSSPLSASKRRKQMIHKADDISQRNQQVHIDRKWWVARPINHRFEGFRAKIKQAWMVLTGKADVVVFYKQ